MKVWKDKIRLPRRIANKYIRQGAPTSVRGRLTVKELTDDEVNKSKLNYAPISHGFVNLFDSHKKFIMWCGVFYAERLIVND